jgi:hypothetical protein
MTAFRKISRVRSFLGTTRWYLSEDCLLASKGNYMVEYRRFYLRDLESITVWPSRLWLLRPIIPGVLFGGLGLPLGLWVNSTSGAIFVGIGLAWVALELVLGPTAKSRIQTTGASVDLPLVKRARRAHKVLAKIDAAVRATRGVIEQPAAPATMRQPAEPSVQTSSEAASETVSAADTTQTNGS